MTDQVPLLEMEGISKSFGTVPVLDGVSLRLLPGEVHVLAGENGAGKSTLIKIASGAYRDYSGEIRLEARPVRFRSPHDAAQQGIAVIYQEMSLVNSLNVVDNLFLGRRVGGSLWVTGAWRPGRLQLAWRNSDLTWTFIGRLSAIPWRSVK